MLHTLTTFLVFAGLMAPDASSVAPSGNEVVWTNQVIRSAQGVFTLSQIAGMTRAASSGRGEIDLSFDNRPCDPRISPIPVPTNAIPLNARNITVGCLLGVVAMVSTSEGNPPWRVECSEDRAVFRDPRRGYLIAYPGSDKSWMLPAIYRGLDARLAVADGNRRIIDVLRMISEPTGTEITMDDDVALLSARKTMHLATGEYTALEILRSVVIELRSLVGGEVVVRAPASSLAMQQVDRSGHALLIRVRAREDRLSGGLSKKELAEACRVWGATAVYFERELDCLWVISARDGWWNGVSWNQVGGGGKIEMPQKTPMKTGAE